MTQPTNQAEGSATPRAMQRPSHIEAPSHWQSSVAPQPQATEINTPEDQPGGRDPVRYGDWEYKGLAIDF